jgi:site-specific recombinase XerD
MTLFKLLRSQISASEPLHLSFFDAGLTSAALDALAHYDVPELSPVIIDDDGDLNWAVTEFGVRVRRRDRSALTAETYAREAEVFARYLRQRCGKSVEQATELDFWAYKRLRREGDLRFRLGEASWNKVAAALLRLKRHLELPGEINWAEFRASADSGGGKVRMINIGQFRIFRDRGMGRAPRTSLRNVAFAELLVTTGLRCSEAANLLRHELKPFDQFSSHRMVELAVPASITKGRKKRDVHYSKRVAAGPMRNYLEEERGHQAHTLINTTFGGGVHRSKSLSQFGEWLFFELAGTKARIVAGANQGVVKPLSLFLPEERKLLVEVRPHPSRSGYSEIVDFGPLWLSEQGPAPSRAAWNAAFSAATSRAGGSEILGRNVSPHTLRHTFAVRQLHHLLTGLVDIRTRRPVAGRRGELYEHLIGDPLRTLQDLLGHARYSTTRKYLTYMEDNAKLVLQAVEAWDRDLG